MKRNFSKQEVIEIGNKLAKANLVCTFKPRSHSHNAFALFPQTEAQYNWLKRDCGTTYNCLIGRPAKKVLTVAPELRENIRPSKSGQSCRIDIDL